MEVVALGVMGRAENRHHTSKWKKRRKNHGGDKCNNAKCTVCHANKVVGIPSRQSMRADTALKLGTAFLKLIEIE